MLPLPHLFPQLELSPPKCPMPVVYSEPHAKPSFCSFIKPCEMDGGAERYSFTTGCLLWNPLSHAQHFHALPYRQWQCKQKLRHLPAAANWPWDSVHNELHRHKHRYPDIHTIHPKTSLFSQLSAALPQRSPPRSN